MDECKVVELFVLEVGIDTLRKDFSIFGPIREMMSYVDDEEDFDVVHEQD